MTRTHAFLFLAAVLGSAPAVAADELTSLHPEQAQPDRFEQSSPDQFTDLIKKVQERLHAHGFDAGPITGEAGGKTQAALVQFQLSRSLPASGQLDPKTREELGLPVETPKAPGG